ncbi:LuxR C-terminal-related transcriptional regulator [Amycolatopsis sacchari]|uniref:DNA-binding response regulator, NarL/FixJ family, contains REC and HTH domains n=1 Tax=Amycolatopsis sacchari TaxID=115433 RepID=A0A1I3PZ77_9PSEU|nr:LuxR C-terminal-related transcriptional regulator [Amycolatopsis sacchari]SFJ26725.1 DNA-binding response regulator, NarL/FixJ family, contains REC and HTH domains [Amycolatopsis sacchari]
MSVHEDYVPGTTAPPPTGPAPEVAYLGEDRERQALLHRLLADEPRLVWRGAVRGEIRELFEDPRSAIVIVDQSTPDPLSAASATRAALPTAALFVLLAEQDTLTPGEWARLTTVVQGVLSLEGLAGLPAHLLAATAEIGSMMRAVSATVDSPAARLTQSEVDVLAAAAEGLTVEETAARLHISVGTGRALMLSARRRLRARTRAEAVAKALRAGLLS